NSYYAITKVGMASITAPTSVFAQKGAVLLDILLSIHQVSAGATPAASLAALATNSAMAATPAASVAAPMATAPIWSSFDYGYTFTNGFYDPGVLGNWAEGYTTAWVSPFVAAEQVYMAQTSTAFDAQCAAWHEQFMAD